MAATILDRDLPVFDVSDSVATLVDAPLAATWQALMEVDLIEVGRRRPLVGILGAIRALPDVLVHLIRGEAMPDMPARLRLRPHILVEGLLDVTREAAETAARATA